MSISSPTRPYARRLARAASLRDLPRLTASFDVTRSGRDGLHVAGEVSATVGQDCVVTLEPIEQNLRRADRSDLRPRGGAGRSPTVSRPRSPSTRPILPEPLAGGMRRSRRDRDRIFPARDRPLSAQAGRRFSSRPAPDEPRANPFAALAALKKPSPATRHDAERIVRRPRCVRAAEPLLSAPAARGAACDSDSTSGVPGRPLRSVHA